jgi:DNA-binding NarL/FixJ family response regulator
MTLVHKDSTTEALRVGLVATDPMRILGMQTVLGVLGIEIVQLSVPRALDMAGLSIVVIDSDATGHLFELLTAFRAKRPQLRLIVLGEPVEHEYIKRVIVAGAKGYLSHNAREGDMETAIGIVKSGSVWAPRKVLAEIIDEQDAGREKPKFTARETEVLELLVMGHPNRQIAQELGIDEGTVKAHVGRLMQKLGVNNRTALTIKLLELGFGKRDGGVNG